MAVLHAIVGGVADDDTRGGEFGRGDADVTFIGEECAHFGAEFDLFVAQYVKACFLCELHHVAAVFDAVSRHGGVVGVAAIFVGLHDVEPFFEVDGKTVAGGGVDDC